MGTVSQGEYLVELMNQVGDDYAALGNHEFDYGMKQRSALLEEANAQYLGCNIGYTGKGESAVSAVEAYAILIAGTDGIDAVLDGHSHSIIPCDVVENREGEEVLLCSTGTGFG